MNNENEIEAALKQAQEASEPGKFSFIDRVRGRAHPTDSVVIYLDEALAYKRKKLSESLDKAARSKKDVEDRIAIEAEIENVDKELAKSKYTIDLRGFVSEDYQAIIDEVREQYPAEYEETVNPLSGERVKTEIPNEDAMKFLNCLLWSRSITKITDPEGNEDTEGISPGVAGYLRMHLPLHGVSRVDKAIQDMRLVTAWMDEIQDESFFRTP